MHILLINNNPVVSRLLKLCVKNRDIEVEEIKDTKDANKESYDILFVDDVLYSDEVALFMEHSTLFKSVLFCFEKEYYHLFDTTIKKPFLPSQITQVIEEVSKALEQLEQKKSVLDTNELKKIKALLDLDMQEASLPIEDEKVFELDYAQEKRSLLNDAIDRAVLRLKPKKIKKFLEGQEITLKLIKEEY